MVFLLPECAIRADIPTEPGCYDDSYAAAANTILLMFYLLTTPWFPLALHAP
jgi:hypothetical protein